ncbi:hypothetical protein ACFWBB_35940 [Streptomyces sp. NPDC060000]|uniref:hypothetical protein n=1 Tax=Streptomyces sp. NPDC060000 TaxID=3347031 RepID=UPI00369381AE
MILRSAYLFGPAWLHLRTTSVSMATLLGTYGWALLVEHGAGCGWTASCGPRWSPRHSAARNAFDRTDLALDTRLDDLARLFTPPPPCAPTAPTAPAH